MTLLRRAPREIYRVYSEEEYLDGAGTELIGGLGEGPIDGSLLLPEPECRDGARRRLHRAAGIALLAAAVGAVICVIALNLARAHGGDGARGSLVAVTRGASLTRAATLTDAQPEATSSRPAPVRTAETSKRPRVLPLGRGSAGPASRRPAHVPIAPPVRRHVDVAMAADRVSRPALEDEAAAAPVSTPASTAPTSASSAPAGSAPAGPPAEEKRPEFGFER